MDDRILSVVGLIGGSVVVGGVFYFAARLVFRRKTQRSVLMAATLSIVLMWLLSIVEQRPWLDPVAAAVQFVVAPLVGLGWYFYGLRRLRLGPPS